MGSRSRIHGQQNVLGAERILAKPQRFPVRNGKQSPAVILEVEIHG